MKHSVIVYMFTISSIIFMGVAVLFIHMERYLSSLLSFVIGILFLCSALSILREKLHGGES